MKKYIFSIFAIFLAIFLLSASFLKYENTYDLTIERTLASDVNFLQIGTGSYEITTLMPKNTWYVGIEKSALREDQSVCATWIVEHETHRECLDRDGADTTDEYYTFPVVTSPTESIVLSLDVDFLQKNTLTVYSMNTLPNGTRLAWYIPTLEAENGVVSRAEWGADETLRYADSAKQKANYQAYLNYRTRDKTQAELDAIRTNDAVDNLILSSGGNTTTLTSVQRYENGHRLVWPIEKVKQVNRIVIHHTDDNLEKNLTDEEFIRAIYAYHAVTRGWGDIGYNYLIGQRGKIYEGRAGGDYVVAAHALYNNMGTVGISVLGDYDTLHLNRDQLAGLKSAIVMAAAKYGITLSSTKNGWKKCTSSSCQLLASVTTRSLLGHQDVGVTDCPGTNIYDLFPSLITELDRPYTPILNPIQGTIDPIPKDEILNTHLKNTATITSASSSVASPSLSSSSTSVSTPARIAPITPAVYFGKKFRVRLSYPADRSSITLSSYDGTRASIFLDYKKTSLNPPTTVTVTLVGDNELSVKAGNTTSIVKNFSYSAPVVSIDSWTRIPDWDTVKQYNDNTFRDTIELYNDHGTLVVVNHLPLEWYLKGLGEVSNTDLVEKIKTITVAARTYAMYYMDAANRKYNTNRYDGTDDPDSFQKYIGYSYEKRSPRVAQMVDMTRGEVIRYQGILIKPWYFSSSDGRTLSALEYCQNGDLTKNCTDIPYLQSVADPAGIGKIRSGHGVGISGIGATYFAGQGWDHRAIIQYYLSGVTVGK